MNHIEEWRISQKGIYSATKKRERMETNSSKEAGNINKLFERNCNLQKAIYLVTNNTNKNNKSDINFANKTRVLINFIKVINE